MMEENQIKKKWHRPTIRSLSELNYFSLLSRGDVKHAEPITSDETPIARTVGLDSVAMYLDQNEVRTLYEFLRWVHISYENEAMRILMLKLREAYDNLRGE